MLQTINIFNRETKREVKKFIKPHVGVEEARANRDLTLMVADFVKN